MAEDLGQSACETLPVCAALYRASKLEMNKIKANILQSYIKSLKLLSKSKEMYFISLKLIRNSLFVLRMEKTVLVFLFISTFSHIDRSKVLDKKNKNFYITCSNQTQTITQLLCLLNTKLT